MTRLIPAAMFALSALAACASEDTQAADEAADEEPAAADASTAPPTVTETRIVVEDGVRYRVEPDGTRLEIGPDGAEFEIDGEDIGVEVRSDGPEMREVEPQ